MRNLTRIEWFTAETHFEFKVHLEIHSAETAKSLGSWKLVSKVHYSIWAVNSQKLNEPKICFWHVWFLPWRPLRMWFNLHVLRMMKLHTQFMNVEAVVGESDSGVVLLGNCVASFSIWPTSYWWVHRHRFSEVILRSPFDQKFMPKWRSSRSGTFLPMQWASSTRMYTA